MYTLFNNGEMLKHKQTCYNASSVRHTSEEFDEINIFNNAGFIALCKFKDEYKFDVIVIKDDEPMSCYKMVQYNLQSINDGFAIYAFQEIMLSSLFKELLDTLKYNIPIQEKYFIKNRQFMVSTTLSIPDSISSLNYKIHFENNIKTNLINTLNLKDKLKKMISAEYNMRKFCQSKKNLQTLSRFIDFFEKRTGLLFPKIYNKVHYSNFKTFHKKINHDKFEEYLQKLKAVDEMKKIQSNFSTLNHPNNNSKLIYNGISIDPAHTARSINVNILGHGMKLNVNDFKIAEALLYMIDRLDSYYADLDRIKLLYC